MFDILFYEENIYTHWMLVRVYIYIYKLLELEYNKFKERSTLGGAVIIMINSSKISVHRFIATTLFRMIEG